MNHSGICRSTSDAAGGNSLGFVSHRTASVFPRLYEGDSGYAEASDISISKTGPFAFVVDLNIKILKGYTQISARAHSQSGSPNPTRIHNASLDLASVLIPLLVYRGLVHEAETEKKILSIDELLASPQASLVCQGDNPLFATGGQ
ncbi:hypothetical protein CF327_g535 [Tilletia walkeri]|uniref:Uncharacterized protein n=1 Tax=Tilletia walkeri TaxID=117179 RepID=A0A8X7N5H9_9BASI|nr:hypothetical protein CF327_g535 [Tilletia walkeri]KAE8265945.1 hypothetical protein A4X09_0g6400 [Tilletia walkeri]